MNHPRRLAATLAGLASALLASAAAAPSALARPAPPRHWQLRHSLAARPPGWNKHPPLSPGHWTGPVYRVPVHTVVTGGMPGWQIALIAIGAALLAAALAVTLYQIRAVRQRATAA